MLSYSLEIDDFSNDDYHLIGIHTPLEDYQLAFFLNKHLHIHFKKANFSLDFNGKNGKAQYSVFEYNNQELEHDFFLLSNTCKIQNNSLSLGLFDTIALKAFLIPERKNVDYFIKIDGVVTDKFVEEKMTQIREITQVTTSYTIETNTLKSKDFLIF